MCSDYLNHYLKMNSIDSENPDSIRNWYEKRGDYYQKEFEPYIKGFTFSSVLELGCGIGGFLYYLKKKDIRNFTGVDISKEELEFCRKYVTDQVIESDAITFLKKAESKYDLIVLYDLIEHITKKDIPEFLRLLHKALNENGRVVVRTPNMASLTASYSRYIDFTHETGLTSESITQVFSDAGFSELSVHNSFISRKRLYLIQLLTKLIGKIYNFSPNKIVTRNLVLTALK